MNKNREHSKFIWIPIYDMSLEIVVADNIQKSRNSKQRLKVFKEPYHTDYIGLTCYINRHVGVFFERKYINHKLIAHELWHVAAAIMEKNNVSCQFSSCHETPALLIEYLHGLVYGQLKIWGIKIK